jgi:ATP-dependent DNA helicase 2 subunit 2
MSGCDVIIPDPSDSVQVRAFSSMVETMIVQGKVLIARFVSRAKSEPRLVVLYPHVGTHGALLYLNQLPTVEDIRDYQFDSLQKCTKTQEEAVSKFIDHMDLDENEDHEEMLKPSETYNPILQYFYQCLEYRAINGEDEELPEMDDRIKQLLNPTKELLESNPYTNTLSQVFNIQRREKKQDKKKRVFWRDIIQDDVEAGINEEMVEKKLEKKKDEAIKEISMLRPIEDFKLMITYKYEDLTDTALEKMKAIIIKLINESFKGSFYIKALECLKALREECNQGDEVDLFNDFMNELLIKFPKEKFMDFWKLIINSKVTLIDNSENSKSMITKEDACNWLSILDKKPIISSTVDLDELIDDIV